MSCKQALDAYLHKAKEADKIWLRTKISSTLAVTVLNILSTRLSLWLIGCCFFRVCFSHYFPERSLFFSCLWCYFSSVTDWTIKGYSIIWKGMLYHNSPACSLLEMEFKCIILPANWLWWFLFLQSSLL